MKMQRPDGVYRRDANTLTVLNKVWNVPWI